MDGTVLIADDDRTIRTVLTQAMTRAGAQVHATSSLTTLMRWVAEGRGDLVVTDVAMPDGNGIEMMPRIAELRPGMPVIVISAQNTIMTAIRANEADAWDYLPKPFDLPDLMHRVARALSETRVRQTPANTQALAAQGPATPGQYSGPGAQSPVTEPATEQTTEQTTRLAFGHPGFPGQDGVGPLCGRSAAMQLIYQHVARVMNTMIPVLISGASGSGKTLIATSIHGFSDRRDKKCLVLDPTIPGRADAETTLLEQLRGGTLLLQDPGDFSAGEQTRLNRFLTRVKSLDGAHAPRLITTSQHDLAALVQDGRFRTDLFYRLNGIELPVPSLAERVEDIPLLAEAFLRAGPAGSAGSGGSGTGRALTDDAEALLCRQSWPGNIRQLKNLIERLAATSGSAVITAEDVQAALTPDMLRSSFVPAKNRTADLVPDVIPSGAGDQNRHGAFSPPQPAAERLADSVAFHLRRYFDLHQGALPPAGLYQRILREMETPLFEIALEATQGNQARCADLLGINRNTLRKKLTALDINVTRGRKMM